MQDVKRSVTDIVDHGGSVPRPILSASKKVRFGDGAMTLIIKREHHKIAYLCGLDAIGSVCLCVNWDRGFLAKKQ